MPAATWDYVVEVLPAIAIEKEAIAGLEELWRDEWGRLLALLVAQFRRLDLAEDGLGDAFESAARTWPRDGVPDNPPAWLLTAARRRILDRLRAEAMAARSCRCSPSSPTCRRRRNASWPIPGRWCATSGCGWCCCAPTRRCARGGGGADVAAGAGRLDGGHRTPLPGSTPTMAARLTRARKSLAHERFEVPPAPPSTCGSGWPPTSPTWRSPPATPRVRIRRGPRPTSAREAIRLVRVLRELLPGHTELDALLALVLLQHSRRDARVARRRGGAAAGAGPRAVARRRDRRGDGAARGR